LSVITYSADLKKPLLFELNFSWFFEKSVLISIVFLVIAVMIFNSNFQMGFIKQNLLPTNIKMIIFSAYVIAFAFSGPVLLISTERIANRKDIKPSRRLFYSVSVFLVFSVLLSILVMTIIQMNFFNNYSNFVFYLTSYLSLISSFGFLSILSFKFFRWFLLRKNYVAISYGILFSLYSCSILLALVYLRDGLAVHPPVITFLSPRALSSNLYSINNSFQNYIGTAYDLLFFSSLIIAWVLSVIILKQYARRIGKLRFWLLVSLPLVFYMTRYAILLDVLHLNTAGTNVIPSSLGQAFFVMFVNSDIQIIGIFFALSFLTISLKLKGQLRKTMIITVIGMVLLFASRDIHAIFVHSYPPGGVVTISFMPIGSYMLFTGLISFLNLAARDKQLYSGLTRKIETDYALFKNLILSEKENLTLKMAKPIIDFSNQWQRAHVHEELSMAEVKEIVHDIMLELKEKKKAGNTKL
jgi:hypothetical protein